MDVERGPWSGRSRKMLRGTSNSAPKKEEPAPKFPRSIVLLSPPGTGISCTNSVDRDLKINFARWLSYFCYFLSVSAWGIFFLNLFEKN